MRIHYNKYITLFASLLTLAGCSDEADNAVSIADKHPIALTVGADAPVSRAVVTDGTGKTLEAFNDATDIWMVMQSEYKALSGDNSAPNDIDFKGSQTTTNCVTMGTTGAKTASNKENVVNFTAANTRYWDDAHARSSALSIWAIAVPGVTGDGAKWGSKTAGTWNTTAETKTLDWSVSAAQDETTVMAEDLCFSNNITKTSETRDERMKYGTTTQYKFDQGKLIFYHALTKITIKLVEGDGFNTISTSDFNLDNITLKGFKLSGTFDVAQGEFTSQAASATPITTMAQKEKTAADMTLEALVVPGTDLNGTLANAIAFSVDKSAFEVSAATLKEKLPAGFDKFEAGKNYVFTFTVNKTDIELTATIAGWDTVEGQNYAPKINITEVYGQEKTETNNFGKGFTFYRSLTQASGYAKGSDVTYTDADQSYSFVDQLYWPDHETHYFFRGIWPKVANDGTPEAKVSASAVAVENVSYSGGSYPSDLMLGYPRKADGSSDETCKVHTTTSGICATEGEIRMNFQYVMSQVEVNLTTSEGADAKNKVVFDSNTKVEIIGGYKEGAIMLENGVASFAGKSKADYTMNRAGSDIIYHDAIIPQTLGDMKFRITVTDPDDNHSDSYETVLGIADIVMSDGSKISSWEPGKRYFYTLYITKTGIKVTATIKDWIEVKNDDPYHIWM